MTQGISDSYVRWRGIEATLQLAQSPNTKIVIIGSGKDGLPVILGNVDTPMQPNPATPRGRRARPRQQRGGHGNSRQARARRSWKRRRPATCRARPNGRRRPRCRGRRGPSPASPGVPPPNSPPGAPPGKQSEAAARGAALVLDLVRTPGSHFTDGRSGERPARRPPPSPMAGPVPHQAAGDGRRPAVAGRTADAATCCRRGRSAAATVSRCADSRGSPRAAALTPVIWNGPESRGNDRLASHAAKWFNTKSNLWGCETWGSDCPGRSRYSRNRSGCSLARSSSAGRLDERLAECI